MEVTIAGYCCICLDRDQHGGGLVISYKDTLEYKPVLFMLLVQNCPLLLYIIAIVEFVWPFCIVCLVLPQLFLTLYFLFYSALTHLLILYC